MRIEAVHYPICVRNADITIMSTEMKIKLRSSFSTEGRRMAGARALWVANGMKKEQFGKPIIAIANSFTQFVPGHTHLHEAGQLVKKEIEKLGCYAAEFNTIAIDDGIAMGHDGMLYSLPSRDIIADSVEYMVNAHKADALVCISNCDKITPGMLMAAMRLNIPTVFVSGGPMEAGHWKGENIDLITTMVKGADPSVTQDELDEIERRACPGCGCISTEAEMKRAPAKWIAENPEAYGQGTRSFWLNAFVRQWASWESIVLKYLNALGSTKKMQVVFNTCFGEPWEDRGDIEDEDSLLARREDYGKDKNGEPVELPPGVLVLTAGVDTQDDRMEYEIVGHGFFGETWGIEKGIVMGRPDDDATWNKLDEVVFDRVMRFENGVGLRVSMSFVDEGGHFTQSVRAQCNARISKKVFCIKGMPGQTNYSAAKGGVIAATKALAQEVAKKHVTVNAVAPGFIRTEMTEDINENEWKKHIPTGRFGEPEEVADLVSFLVSPNASYITGEVISINGGLYT